ncbi:MAG: RDD family protein [Cyclobacteriaceae bacterium]
MSTKQYAGFWLRFVALIIDTIIVNILQSFIIIPVLGMIGLSFASGYDFNFEDIPQDEAIGMLVAIFSAISTMALLSTTIQILYYSLMESSKHQATIGKLALGLQVTGMNGERLDFLKALLRNISKIISSLLMMIGFLIAGFTEKKQALHDIIASTLVVKK